MSEGEYGIEPFDLCLTCKRLYRAELLKQAEHSALLERIEKTLADNRFGSP